MNSQVLESYVGIPYVKIIHINTSPRAFEAWHNCQPVCLYVCNRFVSYQSILGSRGTLLILFKWF